MTAETTIHPRLTEIITANVGNKLTEALSTGLLAMLQGLLVGVAQDGYAAGQEAERQQKQPVQVDDAMPLERDHCRKSFESERNGRHLPKEYVEGI